IFSVVLAAARAAELRLPEQRLQAGGRPAVASIDAREGTTTGISAAERANTARVAADPATRPCDLLVPGHVPPLIAADAGVFVARGAAEGALDLVRLAGGPGAAAICAILDESGRTAGAEGVLDLAASRGLVPVTITEIAARRFAAERPLRPVRRERLVTHHGIFDAVTFLHAVTGQSHLALVRGNVAGGRDVPTAVLSTAAADDLLAGMASGGESRLALVLRRFARAEAGILVHLRDQAEDDPLALDLAAAIVAELGPASVLPLDATLGPPLGERGIAISLPRSAPRQRVGGSHKQAGTDRSSPAKADALLVRRCPEDANEACRRT
ncbi:MAG TPA: 3,4-dihydroxy-2-butanone-4-phosphate synthase, partial [Solirubrobacterales bacterium]|nr:3,4-dihydroxy-2-butanone-4-phosphate synthase [Solirubrobacterales bacterium]